jgi:hydroxymethylglutaryl-CoA lyase
METKFIPTELKVEVINAIAHSGVSHIEATSFVSPRAIPQMRDAQEVMSRIERVNGVRYRALVPNQRGAERAIEARVDSFLLVICASEAYNHENFHMSIAESLAELEEIVRFARSSSTAVETAIALAFGCVFEGPVPEDRVVHLAKTIVDMGVHEITIADSVGLAHPAQIQNMVARLKDELGDGASLSLHIHNTRGLGLANVLAALHEGIDSYDASIGGLGGCPVNPGATGNIPTEDLVNMCEEMGIETGIAINDIIEVAQRMERFLGRQLPGHVLSAGTRQKLYDAIGEARIDNSGQ